MSYGYLLICLSVWLPVSPLYIFSPGYWACLFMIMNHEHTALQQFQRLELIHIAISALPGTYLHLGRAREGEVPYPRTHKRNNVPTLIGEKHPSKNKTFIYNYYNVGPTSLTLVQHCIYFIQLFCVYWNDVSLKTCDRLFNYKAPGPVFSYKLRYIVGF